MQEGERRVVGGDQHTDRRQILGRMHPASRGCRWEPESSWGESVSAPAGPASNAMGGEKAVNAGFGRRKISWSLGDIVRARTTVVAPIRSADAAETPGNSRKCKRGSAASWGATNIPTDAKFWGGCIPQVGVVVGSRSRAGGERFCAGGSGVKRDGRGKGR